MSLLLALALPAGKVLLRALIENDAKSLADIPGEELGAFVEFALKGDAEQSKRLSRIEALLQTGIDQDFERDYAAARMMIGDAARALAADRTAMLAVAWDRLYGAVAGTRDPFNRARALLLAATVAMLRGRREDVVDRATLAWTGASALTRQSVAQIASPGSGGSAFARVWQASVGAATRDGQRRRLIEVAIAAADVADESSRLLAAVGVPGHPVRFSAAPAEHWSGAADAVFEPPRSMLANDPAPPRRETMYFESGCAQRAGEVAALPDGTLVGLERRASGETVLVHRNPAPVPADLSLVLLYVPPSAISPTGRAAFWEDLEWWLRLEQGAVLRPVVPRPPLTQTRFAPYLEPIDRRPVWQGILAAPATGSDSATVPDPPPGWAAFVRAHSLRDAVTSFLFLVPEGVDESRIPDDLPIAGAPDFLSAPGWAPGLTASAPPPLLPMFPSLPSLPFRLPTRR